MPYIPGMTLTDDIMNQEKREEEDLPALKRALTHRHNNFKATWKSGKKDGLQTPETILAIERK